MPNELRCCPDCGSVRFSWITEYIENGSVVDSEHGPYREPDGSLDPTYGSQDYGVNCTYCGTQWHEADLISQDEAYHNPDMSRDWMVTYEPSGQPTLSEE